MGSYAFGQSRLRGASQPCPESRCPPFPRRQAEANGFSGKARCTATHLGTARLQQGIPDFNHLHVFMRFHTHTASHHPHTHSSWRIPTVLATNSADVSAAPQPRQKTSLNCRSACSALTASRAGGFCEFNAGAARCVPAQIDAEVTQAYLAFVDTAGRCISNTTTSTDGLMLAGCDTGEEPPPPLEDPPTLPS